MVLMVPSVGKWSEKPSMSWTQLFWYIVLAPLPSHCLDVLGNLVQLIPPSLSSTTILKPIS